MSTAASTSTAAEALADGRRQTRAVPLALLGLITAAGIVIRIPSLSDALYADELSAYFAVTGHGLARTVEIVQSDQEITPPLYFLLAGLVQGVGDSTTSLRWVPMLAGVAAIPLTYMLGALTVGRRAALVAAAVLAFSPFLIFYSTEARPYALLMVLCLGSTLALLDAVERGARWGWALYALLSCAAMYTHYTGAFLLAGQAAWALLYHRTTWRWILGANLIAALGWLPWLSSYRADQRSPGADLIGALQPFGADAFATDVLHWAISHPLTALSIHDVPGDRAIAPIALGLAIGLAGIGAWAIQRRMRIGPPSPGVALVLILALSTPVLAALYSTVSVSVFLPRNLIASSPGLALLLALIVTAPRPRAVWITATALLLGGFVIAGARMLNDDAHRPNYESMAAFITDRGGTAATTVDAPGLSPGPLSELDVALAPSQPEPSMAALRLGRPPQAAQLRADQPDGPGQFAVLPVPTPQSITERAVRRAGNEPIFLVAGGDLTFDELRGDVDGNPDQNRRAAALAAASTPTAAFARLLPSDYRSDEMRTFRGLFGLGTVTVHMLRR